MTSTFFSSLPANINFVNDNSTFYTTTPSTLPLTRDDLALYHAYSGYTNTPTQQQPQHQYQPVAEFNATAPTPSNLHRNVGSLSAPTNYLPPSASNYTHRSTFTSSTASTPTFPLQHMYATAYNSMAGPAQMQIRGVKRNRSQASESHQRTPSASTVGSNGPASPYAYGSMTHPHVANPEISPDSAAYYAEQRFSKNLPIPAQTPTDSTLNLLQAQHLPTSNAHMAMKDFAARHHSESEGAPSRQSLSSYGNDSPATPLSGAGEMDMKPYSIPANGESDVDVATDFDGRLLFDFPDVRQPNPQVQLFRTESQAYQDELFDPLTNDFASLPPTLVKTQQPQQSQQQNTFLSPHQNLINHCLETANLYRSASPISATSRERSPFREHSPWAPARDWTVASKRREQKEEAEQAEYAQHAPSLNREQTKTISPKDALLDYHDETDQVPLFQDSTPAGYETHSGGTEQWQTNYTTSHGLPNPSPQNMAFRHATPADNAYTGSEFEFQLPQGPDQIPSTSFPAHYEAAANAKMNYTDKSPPFPASLPSMETSASDAVGPSSQEDASTSVPPQRPDDTRARTGAYTCTYHNCTQRFESHAGLQKHKRDSHWAQQRASVASPSADSASARSSESPPPTGGKMDSAAILARNSQAGPHKCSRTNPSTGKPCNTIFSRPYDLTRHEDTIHNGRKQKVKCPYCREEKTFSRNDALTRHMRVVHPEVEAFGKRGRRGE